MGYAKYAEDIRETATELQRLKTQLEAKGERDSLENVIGLRDQLCRLITRAEGVMNKLTADLDLASSPSVDLASRARENKRERDRLERENRKLVGVTARQKKTIEEMQARSLVLERHNHELVARDATFKIECERLKLELAHEKKWRVEACGELDRIVPDVGLSDEDVASLTGAKRSRKQ